jgi:hypothetical protein
MAEMSAEEVAHKEEVNAVADFAAGQIHQENRGS